MVMDSQDLGFIKAFYKLFAKHSKSKTLMFPTQVVEKCYDLNSLEMLEVFLSENTKAGRSNEPYDRIFLKLCLKNGNLKLFDSYVEKFKVSVPIDFHLSIITGPRGDKQKQLDGFIHLTKAHPKSCIAFGGSLYLNTVFSRNFLLFQHICEQYPLSEFAIIEEVMKEIIAGGCLEMLRTFNLHHKGKFHYPNYMHMLWIYIDYRSTKPEEFMTQLKEYGMFIGKNKEQFWSSLGNNQPLGIPTQSFNNWVDVNIKE
jgi:hypothetical protein